MQSEYYFLGSREQLLNAAREVLLREKSPQKKAIIKALVDEIEYLVQIDEVG